jgi:hypothetical protein
MITDYTGAEAVKMLIEHTGLSKFVISRVAAHKNSLPVFEHIEKGGVDKAVTAFIKFAQIADNNIAYEMRLFNSLEDSEAVGEEVRNKKQGKVLAFTFCLNKEQQYTQQTTTPVNQNINVSEAIENALLKYQKQQTESELLRRIEALDAKINATIEEDNEEEEEELNGLNNPQILNLISLLGNVFNPKPQTTVINGIDDDNKIKNINQAIKILHKYDSEIDTDLLKLANIAENNNLMFNTLLKTLRNM